MSSAGFELLERIKAILRGLGLDFEYAQTPTTVVIDVKGLLTTDQLRTLVARLSEISEIDYEIALVDMLIKFRPYKGYRMSVTAILRSDVWKKREEPRYHVYITLSQL